MAYKYIIPYRNLYILSSKPLLKNASAFIERLSFEKGHKMLYSRYTMTSASISVIPEFYEKIEADGTQKYFKTTKTEILN